MGGAANSSQALAILFSLLTALANALALVSQHIASTRKREGTSNWSFVVFLFRQPLWLAGWLGLLCSLVFQALALHFGPISEVQPLIVSEIVIMLLLRRVALRQRIATSAWCGAIITVVGLVVFIVVSSPHGRANVSTPSRWLAPVLVCAVAVAIFVSLALRGSPARRAGLLGAATGVTWALEATFFKSATDVVARSGFASSLVHWPLYAIIGGGIVGLFCEQAALHVGPLRVSQPFIVIVDPIVSVLLGLWLYSEKLHGGALSITVALLGFIAMCAGVAVLTQSAPPTMRAELPLP
jgi:drug/metabolite transporter (DMT)-like permease